ncbi:MAG: hypothetical protein R3D78_14050 [Paracoccaceae bacterium]|nr:hypothetical protein [Pseudothioclava arenosa]
MKMHLIRMIENERLVSATHWAVFGLGAAALTTSLAATVAKVLFS